MLIDALPCLWKFDINDQTTWPWLDYILVGKGENKKIRWIKNPFFKFGHLISGYSDIAFEGLKSRVEERKKHDEITS